VAVGRKLLLDAGLLGLLLGIAATTAVA